jgi:hypothetical protein|tara:strand:+ start:152 stop:931 length:780 start_codon:yes stop_codon:yes gene_type:complete
MKISAENIQSNWKVFLHNIETHISDNKDRKQKLLNFYKKYEERIILMPAAHKKEYHGAFPGGYVDHVNRVVRAAIELNELWTTFGADMTTYTREELIFSAINHDLGKMGDSENEAYIPQTDQWRKDKLGEDYMFNKSLAFASVPDRTLFLLQQHDIYYSFNEMLAIQTHDGLYDPANEKYLKGFMPEQKPRTSLPYILHQADMLAARVEWEMEWLPKFSQNSVEEPKKQFKLSNNKTSTKNKALNSIKSEGLKNMLDNI